MGISSTHYEHSLFKQLKKTFSQNDSLIFAGTLLKRAYQNYPQKTALIGTEKTITYKELYFRSILLSKKLAQQGVKPRDRVMLFFENSLEFYVAYFAIWQLGAVVVPLNIFLHERELAHIITDATPKALVVSKTLKTKVDNLVLGSMVPQLPPILTDNDFDWTTAVPEQNLEAVFPDSDIYQLEPDELCVLLYTSGTTGVPKGVMLSSKNIMTNALQGYARFMLCGMTPNDRFFCVLPLFHVFAQNTCLWLPMMIGASVIIVSKIDRALIMDGLKHKPTLFFGFPALYGLLCLMKTAPLGSVKLFVSGADMLPDKIRAAFAIIYGRKIASGYGLTEASPVVAVNHENDEQATNVVGHVLAEITYQIRDENRQPIIDGAAGTLWIKGDNIMMGYYNAPDATNQVLVDGWLNTGDLAQRQKNGKLAICGRSKDIIIHKGFNIYPAEVENVLMKHPAVFKAAVIGKDEPMSGQVPVAFVAVRSRGDDLEATLRTLCAHNLASYKIPRKFVCLDDLPMSATGKVDKKQLHQSPQS